MEWALLEAEEGNDAMARELFSQGAAAGQPHLPLLSAWASFEEQRGRCAHMPDPSSKKSFKIYGDVCVVNALLFTVGQPFLPTLALTLLF